jgi:eukaryotic translation initiation factor 2C
MALPTQCIKWDKVAKPPRGIHYNVLLKMNFKLGGTSHVLASRLPSGAQGAAGNGSVFQSPPASLSWIFDRPCMLVGIDVSHPEPGMQRESMAAVVGSVDGSATKYVAHISAQTGRQEMVSALTEAMDCLFKAFRARQKNRMPETVIVYRDGVSEGQYDQVLQVELPQIQQAIAQQGYEEGAVRVVVVVCTKGHRTRLVCQENAGAEYVNPCPGLVVDSAITSENLNEFYLNSHAAIQGTSKPCRYTLLYDELGIKMSELQLLTYWTTYLYARCNKSVSYATPAYYAHWASKRGKELLAAGASATQLRQISDTCSRVDSANNMFFL